MLKKLRFRPGIVRDITDYSHEHGWFDCNRIRFRNNYPEQIRGWQKFTANATTDTIRALRRTSDLTGQQNLFKGTTSKMYVEQGFDQYDITPIRATSTNVSNAITTTSGSGTITINDSSHGAAIGDYVIISDAADTNGITAAQINLEFVILTVPDANSYTVLTAGTASSSGTGGGSATDINYLYNTGIDEVVAGVGWGADAWGDGTWGTAADASSAVGGGTLRLWSIDPYGEDVIFTPRLGPPFYWDATTPSSRAIYVSAIGSAADVPTKIKKTVVSERDRHVIALGCSGIGAGAYDPMLVRWADQEDVKDWTATTTNTAGSLRLSQGSEIITGLPTRQEILIWTDTSLYAMRYIGGQLIFGIPLIANGINIAGFNAAVAVVDVVYWISESGFYVYDGRVQELDCPVEEYIKDDIDWNQGDKIYAGSNISDNEIWWFYQSTSSTNNDKYVIYNYQDKVWYYGELPRTAWIDDKFSGYPLAASTDKYTYQQEFGVDDESTTPASAVGGWIESTPIEMTGDEVGDGDHFVFINKVIPDLSFLDSDALTPAVTLTINASNYPGSSEFDPQTPEISKIASTTVEQYTPYKNIRLRGRSFKYKISSTSIGTRWRQGTPRVNIRPDGRQ